LFLENVSANDQKISEINMQLAVLDQVENYVQSKENKGGIVPSTMGVNDLVLSQLLNKLYETELEYEKIKNIEAANYPTVVSLVDQIEKLKPSILENIKSQRTSLEAGKANLIATNTTYSQSLGSMPEKERELIDINREQTIKNNTYAFLLQKREETVLSNASKTPDNRIIDLAQFSLNPVSPNEKVIYAIFLAAALLIGISVITVKETYSSKILYRQEIEGLTNFPVIGEIINGRTKNSIVTGEGIQTFAAEQFRQLRVAISFQNNNSKKKKILITSAMPEEGKSFVALNLAITLAMTGRRVVLLELDLINPGISSELNINSNEGISDYLLSKCNEAQIVNKTNLSNNLFFIPAGPAVTNPSEVLANGKLKSLLDFLDSSFDYMIIDSPPVNLVTDAYIISPYCDLTLYVIRHNRTPKVSVQRIDGNNKISRLHNIAIVFNGVQARGFVKNNYGYGYGYGYTYKEKRSTRKVS
jgi:capsular exopolysaccharide synthesis family protein